MKLGKALLLVVVAAIVGAAAYGYSVIRGGFSARDQPSRMEHVLTHEMREMAIPQGAKEMKSPWAAGAPAWVVASGRAHWADHCAACHANDGSGNTAIGQNLYPKAPDMRLAATQNLSDGELYYIIVNGVRLTGMPAWGLAGSGDADENWHLVAFIRHLPQLTPEEVEQMKALNPKTDADRAEEKQEEEFLNGGDPAENPATVPGHP